MITKYGSTQNIGLGTEIRCVCKLRGRKEKAQQTSQLHQGQLLFSKEKRGALGGIQTYSTLLSRRDLYQQDN